MSTIESCWSGGSFLSTVMSRRIAVEELIVCRSTAVLGLGELLGLRQIVIVDLSMRCLEAYVGRRSHLPLMAHLYRWKLSRWVDNYRGRISLSLYVFQLGLFGYRLLRLLVNNSCPLLLLDQIFLPSQVYVFLYDGACSSWIYLFLDTARSLDSWCRRLIRIVLDTLWKV